MSGILHPRQGLSIRLLPAFSTRTDPSLVVFMILASKNSRMCVWQTLTGAKVEFLASTCLTLLNICSSTGSKCGKAACNGSDLNSYSFLPTERPSSAADGKSQSACLRPRQRPVCNMLDPRSYTAILRSSSKRHRVSTFCVFLLNSSSTAVVCQCSCCGHLRLEATPNYPPTPASQYWHISNHKHVPHTALNQEPLVVTHQC